MILRKLALATVIVLLTVSCGGLSWPPHIRQAESNFNSNRPAFDDLAHFMDANDLWTASHSAVNPPAVGYRTPEDVPVNQLSPDESERAAALLKKAGVLGATRVDSILYLESGMGESGSSDWIYSYVLGSPKNGVYQTCADVDRSAPVGVCHVKLKDDWSVHYRWKPSNPEQLNRAIE